MNKDRLPYSLTYAEQERFIAAWYDLSVTVTQVGAEFGFSFHRTMILSVKLSLPRRLEIMAARRNGRPDPQPGNRVLVRHANIGAEKPARILKKWPKRARFRDASRSEQAAIMLTIWGDVTEALAAMRRPIPAAVHERALARGGFDGDYGILMP